MGATTPDAASLRLDCGCVVVRGNEYLACHCGATVCADPRRVLGSHGAAHVASCPLAIGPTAPSGPRYCVVDRRRA
jgi:hypothetical protein